MMNQPDPNNEKPTATPAGRPRRASDSSPGQNAFAWGLVCGFGTIVFRVWYWNAFTVNDAFATLAWAFGIALGTALIFNIWKSRRPVLFRVLRGTFFGCLIPCFMMTYMCSLVVWGWYGEVSAATEFAQQDFAQFETNGVITSKHMHDVWTHEDDLQANLKQLETAKKTVDAADANDLARGAAQLGLDAVIANERAVALPPEQVDRVRFMERVICTAGNRLPDAVPFDGVARCTATKEQLLDMRAKLDHDYPIWSWLLKRVHVID